MRRLFAIAWKELLQLRRDRLTFALAVGMPLLQLLLFGYAIDTDVKHIPTVVWDQDCSPASRRLADTMASTRYIDIVGHVSSYEQIEDSLKSGAADAAFVIPASFFADAVANRGATLQFIVNGVDPQTVGSALGAVEGMTSDILRRISIWRLDRQGLRAKKSEIQLVPLIKYNPDRRSAVFIVPGLLGVILTLTMVMFTSIALSRERERGTMEALLVSPCRRSEILLGKIMPYVFVGYIQMSLIILVGTLVFQVPLRGSIPLLFAMAAPFIVGNLAVGIVFSTIAKSQQQAMQLSFFFLLPNILLSGFMFPFHAMPKSVQILASALPLTHFLRIARRIILQGAAFSHLKEELMWLSLIALALTLLGIIRFRKKLV